MRQKLTEAEKKARAELRSRIKATNRQLAKWDSVLSALLAVVLLIWLFVYGREGVLQGAIGSVWFWIGLAGGIGLLAVLVRKLVVSLKEVRKP